MYVSHNLDLFFVCPKRVGWEPLVDITFSVLNGVKFNGGWSGFGERQSLLLLVRSKSDQLILDWSISPLSFLALQIQLLT